MLFRSGTALSTGTVGQTLQVAGVNSTAYIGGQVSIGITLPGSRLHVVPTGSEIAGIFSGTTTADLVRITQLGTGNAFVVEDSANSDATPFVIDQSGQVGLGTNTPAAILDVRGNAWFSPNTDGTKATALRLGRFTDGVNPAFDVITDDATGDTLEFRSNRFNGFVQISRSSPVGIHTVFQFDSNVNTGNSISIGGTLGTSNAIKVQIHGSANTWFLNDGAVLVGKSSSTGTGKLQVSGDGYYSGNLGINSTSPTSRLDVVGDAKISGIVTFTNTTNNTLGNPDTGAVQIDGGLGVNQNVSIGGSLNVSGTTVSFTGGSISLSGVTTFTNTTDSTSSCCSGSKLDK